MKRKLFILWIIIVSIFEMNIAQSVMAFGAPGELDTTFNSAGTNPGLMDLNSELQVAGFPTATVAKVLCQYDNGLYFIAGDDGTDTYITQMSPDDIQTEEWGTNDPLDGLLILADKANVVGMIFLQSGALIAVGGIGYFGSQDGWVQQFSSADGALNLTFNPTTTLDAHYAVAQQSNGRILVVGGNAGVGTIIAYNSETGAVDTTFGINGIYTATGYGVINSILVDVSDNIYCVANDTSSNAKVIKLVASGAEVDSDWVIPTVIANSSIAANNHLAFDQTGNILAIAVDTTNNVTNVMLYIASNGTLSASLGLANVSRSGNFATGITVPNMTSIFVDMNTSPGKVILTGFDSNATPAVPFILRTNTAIATGPDITFNADGVNSGVQKYNTLISGVTTNWYAGMINADGEITVAGYASVLATPYLIRVYGDEFVGQYLLSVDAGVPGTIDTDFATNGYLSLIGDGQATSAIPTVVLPTSTPSGAQYVAFDDGTISRYTNGDILDSTYGLGGHTTTNCPTGVYSMSLLGNGGLLLAGTSGTYGWVEQFTTAGVTDPDFNGGVAIDLGTDTKGTVAVQQSLSRIVVAGQLATGNGGLFAFTNTGIADTTFAIGSTSDTGVYDTGIASTIYTMLTDQYDRLIIAYKNGTNIDVRRLTPSGELDTTFGVDGTISGAFTSGTVDDETQVRVTIDAAGDIVIAAHIDTPAITTIKYDNIIGNVVAPGQLDLPSLVTPVLTGLIATADGNVLVSGNSTTSTYQMWVARITSLGVLDTGIFNPVGAIPGIMEFATDLAETPLARNLTSIAIYGDGQISMVGSETSSTSTTNNPFMSRAYCSSYTTQEPIDLKAQLSGTNDFTFGAGVEPNYVENGISFYATTDGINQYAKAAVMQADNANGLVVALDGESTPTNPSNSYIYLNMFDIDGLLDTDFVQPEPYAPDNIAPGQMLVLSMFDNQYVHDMLTFTVDGISKAILAGYARNSSLGVEGSLLMQCVLTPSSPGLDSSFGGFNNNSLGVAFGDGKQLNTVGLQSTGRIIAGGHDQDFNGLLLGYTPAGNLDQSFGQGGTFIQGTTGIYTCVIDSSDRLVVAYYVDETLTIARILADGSGLDETFAGTGVVTTTITSLYSNESFRLVIDGLGNIVVAAVIGDQTSFSIARYTSAGVLSGNVVTIASDDLGSLIALNLTKLLIDSNNTVVFVGSDYDDAASQVLVVRLVYSESETEYILDETFNLNGTPGYIKYEVDNLPFQHSLGAFIHPDGRIIITGAVLEISAG